MLYILQFSTYFLSLVTVPYQTRVLGPVVYGYVGVALAVMAYFQLFMDFGFLLSAGAGFIEVKTGEIVTLPGLPRNPLAAVIDLKDGAITGMM